MNGGLGANTLWGGNGNDTADYSDATAACTITLDHTANDGPAGVDDVVTNVENVNGSRYDDSITGSNLANAIGGGAGNDTLVGGTGNDTLSGGWGTTASTAAWARM